MHNDLLDTILVSRSDSTTAAADSASASASTSAAASPPTTKMASTSASTSSSPTGDEAKCPVDHKTRETWLQQARSAALPPSHPTIPAAASSASQPATQPQTPSSSSSSWLSWFRLPFSQTSESPTAKPPGSPTTNTKPPLDESRVISSIPRSSTPGASSCPSNHEQETGASASGNWIYPSEKMFFDAMRRKGFDAAAASDMKTVVPIHNAVNEKAWAEILRWEQPYVAPKGTCGGPRLHSFAGLSNKMTPRARMNTLLGYTAPFDRHDWVVDRCGTTVEYVIDFYAGRSDGTGGKGKLNFYLDVRPKLNSWEGFKMRALRAAGLA